jgi:hypothetical protein
LRHQDEQHHAPAQADQLEVAQTLHPGARRRHQPDVAARLRQHRGRQLEPARDLLLDLPELMPDHQLLF